MADNGPGIPAPMRAKVLQRFFWLEASPTTPGSGLGLSLTAVAALYDARLELADNAPGLRASITFRPAGGSAAAPQEIGNRQA